MDDFLEIDEPRSLSAADAVGDRVYNGGDAVSDPSHQSVEF